MEKLEEIGEGRSKGRKRLVKGGVRGGRKI